jgi:hypothetical protein
MNFLPIILELLNASKRVSVVKTFGVVSDAYAQKIIGSDVIIPLHNFKQPSRWWNRVEEAIKYESGVVTYGITFIPNFINFRPAILQLLNFIRFEQRIDASLRNNAFYYYRHTCSLSCSITIFFWDCLPLNFHNVYIFISTFSLVTENDCLSQLANSKIIWRAA